MDRVDRFLDLEFRYRIFVSLGIALVACIAAYGLLSDVQTVAQRLVGKPWGRTAGFAAGALLCLVASVLRMSAGTVLRSGRVMSFDVRAERLLVQPPYTLVRNPIYLSDLLASTGLALGMPWPGVLYPTLLAIHYHSLIIVEEKNLGGQHTGPYVDYCRTVPRLIPSLRSFRKTFSRIRDLCIDADGVRYNALYVLFVPGLVVSCFTGEFFHAAVIGLPAVADWAVWHTKKGLQHTPSSEVPS